MSPSVQPDGRALTVNEELYAVWLLTVTEKVPLVAPAGTITVMLALDQFVTTALVPLSDTVLLPCEAPKFVPVRVTAIPTAPEVGVIPVTVGACAQTRPEEKKSSAERRTRTCFKLCGYMILPSQNMLEINEVGAACEWSVKSKIDCLLVGNGERLDAVGARRGQSPARGIVRVRLQDLAVGVRHRRDSGLAVVCEGDGSRVWFRHLI